MEHQIRELLKNTAPRWRTRRISADPKLSKWIAQNYPGVQLNIVLDCILKGTDPYCLVCRAPIKTVGKKTCSKKCGSKTVDYNSRNQKRKETFDRNPEIIKEASKKRIETLEKKYGAKVSPTTREKARERAKNLNSKGRRTLKERYGVDNPAQLENHRDKCKATLLENYGVDHYFKSQQFQKQRLEKNQRQLQKHSKSAEIKKVFTPSKLVQYENPNLRISFECIDCGHEETLPSETWKWRCKQYGNPCSKCNNILNGSKQEQEVRTFIEKELGINTISNYKLDNRKEIDIFIPSKNIGFEYDGLYWHNDTRLDQNYHRDKTEYCAEQGIQLFHIFEDEWLHKQDIVKSRIRYILHKTTEKIAARDCGIKEIDSQTASQFLCENHIQGSGRSNTKIGLYYQNDLVSVMTFLHNDISKNIKGWELNRFCSRINCAVVGAAGKLFSYFVNTYNPGTIISFSDRRWSRSRSIYSSVGFEFCHNTRPNYWYFLPGECVRYHRYSLRKPDNCSVTERELRESQGYLRVYDCGSSKWIWHNKKG